MRRARALGGCVEKILRVGYLSNGDDCAGLEVLDGHRSVDLVVSRSGSERIKIRLLRIGTPLRILKALLTSHRQFLTNRNDALCRVDDWIVNKLTIELNR